MSRRLSSIEVFVAALRGCPDVGALLVDVAETRAALMPILAVSNESARYEGRAAKGVRGSEGWHDLSKREQEVLQLVASGMTNPQIGAALFIAEGTVKVHVQGFTRP